jgi:protease I
MRRFVILSFLVLFLSPVALFNCNTVEARQALLIIFDEFGEGNYSETRSILENKGIKVLVASTTLDPVAGHVNMKVKPDLLLNQVRTAEYDAIVFMGAYRYEGDNADAIRIAKEGAAEGKVLAAISVAITTLIKADLLKGKRVATGDTFWAQKAGASVSTAPVEQDGRIITAIVSAPQKIAETVAKALTAGSQ